jgi:hypothetical protein
MAVLEKQARTISAFLDACQQLSDSWSDADTGDTTPWYRGQQNANWSLIPGEYRYALLDAAEIRSEFILKARELLRLPPTTDWEWYFLMQHYGLPTRLLDWTSGSLIGLHFALSANTGKTDAAVWVLDPWALNSWSCGCSDLVLTGGEFREQPIARKYLRRVYQRFRMAPKPLAIVPPYNSSRITAQRGTFTVHGSSNKGLEKQFARRLAKIVIPKAAILQLRQALRTVGVSEFTLFPDLDGLCRDIRTLELEGF